MAPEDHSPSQVNQPRFLEGMMAQPPGLRTVFQLNQVLLEGVELVWAREWGNWCSFLSLFELIGKPAEWLYW